MRQIALAVVLIIVGTFLNGCSQGPGDLEGTWRLQGIMPMTVIYRDNQEEAMGIISEVTYSVEGNDVLVTYTSGLAEGHTIRYTRVDNNTFRSELGTLRRVR